MRVALGVIWLIDAGLQAQPALFDPDWWRNDLAQSVMGQPAAINHSIFSAVSIIAAHAAVWNSAFVAVQAALGLALVLGRFERAAIIASIPWAAGIWWVGEGFGTLPTGFALAAAGSPGPVVLYPLLGLLAWPDRRAATADTVDSTDASSINWKGGATAWVILWGGQTLLQIPWAFSARQTLLANISEYSSGQPSWLQAIAHGTATLARNHPLGLSLAMAVAQVAVGVGVLHPTSRRAALGAGIALSIAYWFAFQYLGTIPAGDATDPGTAPLVILLAISLWPSPKADPLRLDPESAPSLVAAARRAPTLGGHSADKSAVVTLRGGIRPGGRLRNWSMEFDIEAYKARTDRLRWDDLELRRFATEPLETGALRCLRYMHDVEYHTVCYLRDLLVSPAHADAEITSFLSFWVYEEFWHGEALAAVLEAHREPAGQARVAAMRRRLGWAERLRPLTMMAGSALAGHDFVAVHMAWGAINEWTTQAGYAQLARRAGHPVLTELLKRIMRQEGRHIDFYASQAQRRLAASGRARHITRFALRRFWGPVGSGVMPPAEIEHLATYLMNGPDGLAVARRIDRRVDRLPGLEGLSLLEGSITSLQTDPPRPAPQLLAA
ncbi:MAG: hypothetical protein ACRDYY_05500 [Acidimicrobiales bacterium]